LGVPKAFYFDLKKNIIIFKSISTMISGEMRDTAELGSILDFVKDNFVSKDEFLGIFRSFGSVPSMTPKGNINLLVTFNRW
jgi:hypothetical protein